MVSENSLTLQCAALQRRRIKQSRSSILLFIWYYSLVFATGDKSTIANLNLTITLKHNGKVISYEETSSYIFRGVCVCVAGAARLSLHASCAMIFLFLHRPKV